jgi:hypothetical protein
MVLEMHEVVVVVVLVQLVEQLQALQQVTVGQEQHLLFLGHLLHTQVVVVVDKLELQVAV